MLHVKCLKILDTSSYIFGYVILTLQAISSTDIMYADNVIKLSLEIKQTFDRDTLKCIHKTLYLDEL